MKKQFILNPILVVSAIILLHSCTVNDDDLYQEPALEESWQQQTKLEVLPVFNKETFKWEVDTYNETGNWKNDEVELNMKIVTTANVEFTKVDFYSIAEEKNGYNYSKPFDAVGKKIHTVSLSGMKEFSWTLKADEVYNLFINDFKNDRSGMYYALEGDKFLLYWVITASNGSVLDSRLDPNYDRYLISTKVRTVLPKIFEGEFDFEWIELTKGAEVEGGVSLGETGTVLITYDEDNDYYLMDNLLWNYFYGSPGKLYYKPDGLVYVEGENQEKWTISNINGNSMDIEFWYMYSDEYDEIGKVRFTRKDGKNWPTNLYTN